MRIRPTLLALLLTTGLAHAQTAAPSAPPATKPATAATTPATAAPTPVAPTPAAPTTAASTPATTAPAASTTHPRRTFEERFTAANTTHDGKLTLDQAKAGHLRAVARDFAIIDKSKHGYVTLDEIKSHQADQRAARKAARDAKKPS